MKPSIFQVNLSGVLKVLSDSLYSSWEVFLRELIQNANDALTARKLLGDNFTPSIDIEFFENEKEKVFILKDNGIGLTEAEMNEFLSRIGSSSKSSAADLLNNSDDSFIGQFGIGLLSCFMVSDNIEVTSTSAKAQTSFKWIGKADGTYHVEAIPYNETVGSKVRLSIKPSIHLNDDKLKELIELYGSYISTPVTYSFNLGEATNYQKEFPWLSNDLGSSLRFGKQLFNEQFRHYFPIQDRSGSTKGIAYILPRATHTGTTSQHAVYIKRMFITDKTDKILPDWAFFLKAVVNSNNLSTTASREDIYDNEQLRHVEQELGESIKAYLQKLSIEQPDELKEIVLIHHQALKSIALEDDNFFNFIVDWFQFPTTEGILSLKEINNRAETIQYVSDIDEFRQISPIARSNNQLIINAGYIHDTAILTKLGKLRSTERIHQIDAGFFGDILKDIPLEVSDKYRNHIEALQYSLVEYDTKIELKAFEPNNLPALLYMSQETVEKRDFKEISNDVDDMWGDVTDAVIDFDSGFNAKIYLNYNNPIVQKLLNHSTTKTVEVYVQMIYFNALMMGHYPITNKELNHMNENLLQIIETSL